MTRLSIILAMLTLILWGQSAWAEETKVDSLIRVTAFNKLDSLISQTETLVDSNNHEVLLEEVGPVGYRSLLFEPTDSLLALKMIKVEGWYRIEEWPRHRLPYRIRFTFHREREYYGEIIKGIWTFEVQKDDQYIWQAFWTREEEEMVLKYLHNYKTDDPRGESLMKLVDQWIKKLKRE